MNATLYNHKIICRNNTAHTQTHTRTLPLPLSSRLYSFAFLAGAQNKTNVHEYVYHPHDEKKTK